jgi:murein L,D-transpeptidase YcbB/YkuD
MYLTAWGGEDGVVNFRDDVYDRDHKLSVTTLPN